MGLPASLIASPLFKVFADPRMIAVLGLTLALGIESVRLNIAADHLKAARAEAAQSKADLFRANENVAALQASLKDQNATITSWKAVADAAQAKSAQDRAVAAKAMSAAQQRAGAILAAQPASVDDCQAAKALLAEFK